MNNYELMIITNPSQKEDLKDKLVKKIEKTITSADGKIVNTTTMGKRPFAYKIDKLKEGIYTVIRFDADTKGIKELEKKIRLEDEIVRFLVVKLEAQKEIKAKKTKKS